MPALRTMEIGRSLSREFNIPSGQVQEESDESKNAPSRSESPGEMYLLQNDGSQTGSGGRRNKFVQLRPPPNFTFGQSKVNLEFLLLLIKFTTTKSCIHN
jgi:hypothetical protein